MASFWENRELVRAVAELGAGGWNSTLNSMGLSSMRNYEGTVYQYASPGTKGWERLAVNDWGSIYNRAVSLTQQWDAEHRARLDAIERQRQESAAAHNKEMERLSAQNARMSAWGANSPHQNRQNQNQPDVRAATQELDVPRQNQPTDAEGDVGGRIRRRGRGSLSSNLGIRT